MNLLLEKNKMEMENKQVHFSWATASKKPVLESGQYQVLVLSKKTYCTSPWEKRGYKTEVVWIPAVHEAARALLIIPDYYTATAEFKAFKIITKT